MKYSRQELLERFDKLRLKVGNVCPIGRVNLYTCPECGHQDKAHDIDNGTTPTEIECPMGCILPMKSQHYVVNPAVRNMPTDIEWYRPDFSDLWRLNKQGQDELLDSVLDGRMLMRRMRNRAERAYTRTEIC